MMMMDMTHVRGDTMLQQYKYSSKRLREFNK